MLYWRRLEAFDRDQKLLFTDINQVRGRIDQESRLLLVISENTGVKQFLRRFTSDLEWTSLFIYSLWLISKFRFEQSERFKTSLSTEIWFYNLSSAAQCVQAYHVHNDVLHFDFLSQ